MQKTPHLALVVLTVALSTPASAFDMRAVATLKRMDPETRLVQVCDLAAMERISKDRNAFKPDRVMLDQLSPPRRKGESLQGTGGVFRSNGEWYHLSFKCAASEDRLKVLSFSYQVGARIERDAWEKMNLFP